MPCNISCRRLEVEVGTLRISRRLSAELRSIASKERGTATSTAQGLFRQFGVFKGHHTVIDPTAGWGEMASHSKEVDVASFEPSILKAPFTLDTKFRGNTSADQMHARLAQSEAVIGALLKGGVTIVSGSGAGLVGYGLQRELEIYVEADMTPLEAI